MPPNKREFDSTNHAPLAAIGTQVKLECRSERITNIQPLAYLNVHVDGRETTYFEWLGAGLYSVDRLDSSNNGRSHALREFHYGFGERFFYLRVDAFPEWLPKLRDCEFRIMICNGDELRLVILIEEGKLVGWLLDGKEVCILGPHELVEVAFERILEVAIDRRLFSLAGRTSFSLKVALWWDGLLIDSLPFEISLDVILGTDAFAWLAQ